MRIIFNGQVIEISSNISILSFLEVQGIDVQKVVAEKNSVIVPVVDFGANILEDGDILEVLHFVGGG